MRHTVVAVLLGPAGIANQRAAKALGLHLFQVAGDGGLGHIAVEPPPVSPEAGAVGWISEALLQLVGLRRASTPAGNPRLGQDAEYHRTGGHEPVTGDYTSHIDVHLISSSKRCGFA